ncbi:MAG: DUF1800 domain-containing protein [Opitutus sp.]
MTLSVASDTAWDPIAPDAWDAGCARHLLRRAGWSARPSDVERALSEGLSATITRLFPASPLVLSKPASLVKFESELGGLVGNVRGADGPGKRLAQRELRERSRDALQDLRLHWLQMAANPDEAARAKWILFLSDVYVVSAEKVRNPAFIWRHFDVLAKNALGTAPMLTKAVSRSPAMATYLDLRENKREAPNENFARELFELFVLGEGHYTENDIKEAARAFTGYRVLPLSGDFRLAVRQQDLGAKTIFKRSGRFGGDDVVDLAYTQPAAAEFLPGELVAFYLTDEKLPTEHVHTLGQRWRAQHFQLTALVRTFFSSRLFYASEFRGNFIKSPIQLYQGLMQELQLSVPPLPRYTLNPLRSMGQQLFQPPNVRGWVGGRTWINSSTLAARRQLVQHVFSPLREDVLNADEQRALSAARARGATHFTVPDEWCERRAAEDVAKVSTDLARTFLAGEPDPKTIAALTTYLGAENETGKRAQRVCTAAVSLLQTPAYQLC